MTIRRRNLLRGSGAAMAALAAAPKSAAHTDCHVTASSTATYVLVHGTWHGGWVWQDVADRLRARGHRVYTPTCTGCGERLHLTNPDVGLETHITDITQVIEFEDLDEVILVGHSFSGITDHRRGRPNARAHQTDCFF
jgi:pimeloyl-ACP methyl ester carboxylesterase